MLETRQLAAPANISAELFLTALFKMRKKGWIPAALQANLEFFKISGGNEASGVMPIRFNRNYPAPTFPVGDVFFSDEAVFYAIFLESVSTQRESHVEVGAISTGKTDLDKHLLQFSKDFKEALLKTMGQAMDQVGVTWSEPELAKNRVLQYIGSQEGTDLQELGSQQELGSEEVEVTDSIRFRQAQLDDNVVHGAGLLTSVKTREILRELAEAVFAREQDIISRRSRVVEEVESILSELQASGLVVTQHLLQCRRNNMALTRLEDPAVLASAAADLICASCNRKYADELLTEGYSLSNLGRELNNQSHWMTVWVTKKLVELGIPLESIFWNLEQSGEEVDILAGLRDQVWIFELKDREFGAGDAHSLNYRRVRYGADRAVIVTTDHVSQDAKRVFGDLARELYGPSSAAVQSRRESMIPIYVEGLDKLEPVLESEIAAAAWKAVASRLDMLSVATGFEALGRIAERYGQVSARLRSQQRMQPSASIRLSD